MLCLKIMFSYPSCWKLIVFIGVHGSFCFLKTDNGPQCLGATSWMFFALPLAIYLAEKVRREVIGRLTPATIQTVKRTTDVTELRFRHPRWKVRNEWKYKPGQYMFQNCPVRNGIHSQSHRRQKMTCFRFTFKSRETLPKSLLNASHLANIHHTNCIKKVQWPHWIYRCLRCIWTDLMMPP